MALVVSRRFFKLMAQPFDQSGDGISLWTLEDIKAHQADEREKMAGRNGNVLNGERQQHLEEIFEGMEDTDIMDLQGN